ncbi:MAG: hypothetical protein ACFFA4_12590 [Promethearchaeota archaeon]
MSTEYYMFLEEIRMISGHIDMLQKSTNQKVLKSMFFMEDLISHIDCVENLLARELQK